MGSTSNWRWGVIHGGNAGAAAWGPPHCRDAALGLPLQQRQNHTPIAPAARSSWRKLAGMVLVGSCRQPLQPARLLHHQALEQWQAPTITSSRTWPPVPAHAHDAPLTTESPAPPPGNPGPRPHPPPAGEPTIDPCPHPQPRQLPSSSLFEPSFNIHPHYPPASSYHAPCPTLNLTNAPPAHLARRSILGVCPLVARLVSGLLSTPLHRG